MKIISKVFKYLWFLIVGATVLLYCLSALIGYQVKTLAVSSIESMGKDYIKYQDKIDQNNYQKLWNEKADNASFNRILIQEQGKTQKYTVSNPYIMFFKDKNSFFSFSKAGYIYNIEVFDKDGGKTTVLAEENSRVVLDLKYKNNSIFVENVFYDNDFDEYSVSKYNGIFLGVILLINAFTRNIRYFDFCVKNKRKKKNPFIFLQPYIFVLLTALAIAFDFLPFALIIGIAEELIFTLIFLIIKSKQKKMAGITER